MQSLTYKTTLLFTLSLLVSLCLHAQSGRQIPPSQCPDTITTKGGRKVVCRIDGVFKDKLALSLPYRSSFMGRTLPFDSVGTITAGSKASVKKLQLAGATLPWASSAGLTQGPAKARSRSRVELAFLPGGSYMLAKNAAPTSYLGHWYEAVVRQAWQYGGRLSFTSNKGVGAYLWFDTRGTSGSLDATSGSYSFQTFGVGFMYLHFLPKKRGYLSFNGGLGYGSFDSQVTYPDAQATSHLEAAGSGPVVDLGTGAHIRVAGPLHLGAALGLMLGTAGIRPNSTGRPSAHYLMTSHERGLGGSGTGSPPACCFKYSVLVPHLLHATFNLHCPFARHFFVCLPRHHWPDRHAPADQAIS